MDLAEFDYTLPEELIAQTPLADRAASRMLVIDRTRAAWEDRQFRDLPAFLRPGDCLVLNDSRVFPARLFGHRAGVHALPIGKKNPARHAYLTGEVEVLLLRPVDSAAKEWEALVHPGKKMRVGERVLFADGLEAEVIARREFGERTLRFHTHADGADVYEEFEKIGHVALPPDIKRRGGGGRRERAHNGSGDARRRSAGIERRDGPVHLSGLRVSRHRRDAHQFPSAPHQPAAAGVRLRRQGSGAGRPPSRTGATPPVLLVWRLHLDYLNDPTCAGVN